jgi:hypothetical protein
MTDKHLVEMETSAVLKLARLFEKTSDKQFGFKLFKKKQKAF